MNKLTLSFALFFAALSCGWSQHETLFDHARVVGAFIAPITEYGLRNDLNTSVGGGAALVINGVFVGGYGLASADFERIYENGELEVLDIGHGGIWLGGTFQPHSLVHLYASTRLGWGAMNIDLDDGTPYRELDKIFVATPEIGLELNVTRWFRVAGTVGYRYLTGVNENRGLRDEDFSGTVAGVTLRFGWFGRKRHHHNW